jgi:phosphoglycolate phosphatase
MLAPRVIVFDLDGTLLNTSFDIAKSCNHALEGAGLATQPMEQILRHVGDGARLLMARTSGLQEGDARLDAVVDAFLRYYEDHPIVETTWLPYATHALEELGDMPMALCTNKPRAVADRILEALHADERFALVVGGGDVPRGKPAPDGMRLIATTLGVDTKELVVVGDGPQDVLAGKAVGARTIAVATGFTSKVFLRELRPDVLLDDLQEVPDIVKRWREATVRARRPDER